MAISKLAHEMLLNNNYTVMNNKVIKHITIHHCAVVNASVLGIYKTFNNTERQASSNYFIDSYGDIYCFVDESNRAWTSGNAQNDSESITIEVSNDSTVEWHVSDEAYNSLIKLCADICNRYNLTANFDDTASATFNLHRHFQATECPGKYLYEHMLDIVDSVNNLVDCEYFNIIDDIECYYKVYNDKKWHVAKHDDNIIKIEANTYITAIAFKCKRGELEYSVSTLQSGWYPAVYSKNFNLCDDIYGYAGYNNEAIDCIQILYLTDDKDISQKGYFYAKYRVKTFNFCDFFDYQIDDIFDVNKKMDGYAGLKNNAISAFELEITNYY